MVTASVDKSSYLPDPPRTSQPQTQIVSCQEPGGRGTNIAAGKDHILHDSTDMKCPEKASLQRQKVDECLPGAGGGSGEWL